MKRYYLAMTILLASPTALHAADASSSPAGLWTHIHTAADLGERRAIRAEWHAGVPGGALRLIAVEPARYAWATVPAPTHGWNLARRANVEADITNRGTVPAEVLLWAVGDRGWDAVGDFATLAPGERHKFSCRLRATFPDGTPKLDPGQIKQVQVMLAKAALGATLEVRGLAAVGQAAEWSRPPGRLDVPRIEEGPPAAGRRVRYRLGAKENSGAHCLLYLPADWKLGVACPLIVEFPGNVWYSAPCYSTGLPDQCVIGYGMTKGKGAIWVSLPFVDHSAGSIVEDGWGDADATADYAIRAVEEMCRKFGADRKNVLLTGFSRGAIACGYIGLRNDRIASLWKGFHACQHYDGDGWHGAAMPNALERARRFTGSAVFHTDNSSETFRPLMDAMHAKTTHVQSGLGFHACAMFLDDRPSTQQLRKWFADLVGNRKP